MTMLRIIHRPFGPVLAASLLSACLAVPALAGSKEDSGLKNQKIDIKKVSKPDSSDKSSGKKTDTMSVTPTKIKKVSIPSGPSSDSSGSSAPSSSGSGAPNVPEPSHMAVPPDMDIMHANDDPRQIKEIFDMAPARGTLDDPQGLPFDEDLLDDARDNDPGRWPLPEEVDPSKIPGRGDGRAGMDGIRPPDQNDYDMNDSADRETYQRKSQDYGRAFLEGDVYDADYGLVFNITYEEWMSEYYRNRGPGGGFTKDSRNPSADPANITYGELYIQDEDEMKGGKGAGYKPGELIADDDGGKPPVDKDPEPEGGDPDELWGQATFTEGQGAAEGYVRDGMATPKRPRDMWQHNRDEKEGKGGPAGDNPGDGPDRVGDNLVDLGHTAQAMSPSIGDDGDGSGTGPTGPEYSPTAVGTVALPDMGAAASPSIGDGGEKDPDGPTGPEF